MSEHVAASARSLSSEICRLVEGKVQDLLGAERQSVAHRFDHIMRVLANAELIAKSYPQADIEILTLAVLLHDIDQPFDDKWITVTFDAFFHEHARAACDFTSLFLDPVPDAAKELLIAQYGSDGRADNDSGRQRIANAFFENFNDPRRLTATFRDMQRARAFITQITGRSWIRSAVRGRGAVLRDQLF